MKKIVLSVVSAVLVVAAAAGVASAFGIAAGTLVHIALVAGGLAAILAEVPVAYTIVRLAGAMRAIAEGAAETTIPGFGRSDEIGHDASRTSSP